MRLINPALDRLRCPNRCPHRCATCKWYRLYATTGVCAKTPSVCGEAYDTKTLAWAEDLDLATAWLNVKPEFGCVQWESREENDDHV